LEKQNMWLIFVTQLAQTYLQYRIPQKTKLIYVRHIRKIL
jgi:hypothetical protein